MVSVAIMLILVISPGLAEDTDTLEELKRSEDNRKPSGLYDYELATMFNELYGENEERSTSDVVLEDAEQRKKREADRNNSLPFRTEQYEGAHVPNRMIQTIRDEAVFWHNYFRRLEVREDDAGNMFKLVWNEGLAENAQALTDTCTFAHNNKKLSDGTVIGQNLYLGTGKQIKKFQNVVGRWFAEKYVDEEKGHYFQIIEGRTRFVGCAMTKCPDVLFPVTIRGNNTIRRRSFQFIACDYTPGTSRESNSIGTPCSNCFSSTVKRFYCDNGLCASCTSDNEKCSSCTSDDEKGLPLSKGICHDAFSSTVCHLLISSCNSSDTTHTLCQFTCGVCTLR